MNAKVNCGSPLNVLDMTKAGHLLTSRLWLLLWGCHQKVDWDKTKQISQDHIMISYFLKISPQDSPKIQCINCMHSSLIKHNEIFTKIIHFDDHLISYFISFGYWSQHLFILYSRDTFYLLTIIDHVCSRFKFVMACSVIVIAPGAIMFKLDVMY